jgi:hypothetical protein
MITRGFLESWSTGKTSEGEKISELRGDLFDSLSYSRMRVSVRTRADLAQADVTAQGVYLHHHP